MPVVQVSKAPSRSEYEAVARHLNLATERPDGLIVHAASETPAGEIEIVDVWQTGQQFEAFARDRLFPAFAATGMMEQIAAGPQPQPYEPFDFVT